MNYSLIYFGIVLFILVTKFVLALCTIGKLKTFIANNKSVIEDEKECFKNENVYNRLFAIHIGRLSYGKDYEESMLDAIENYYSSTNLLFIFLFATLWPIAVPTVLGCLLVGYCSNLFNKFLGKVLDENEKQTQLS